MDIGTINSVESVSSFPDRQVLTISDIVKAHPH